MSHVYSFCLFCAFLYLTEKSRYLIQRRTGDLFMLALLGSLIVIIRPINLIVLTSFIFLETKSPKEIISRLRTLCTIQPLVIFLFVFFLLLLPQLIYWHYSTGSMVTYSYGNERFYWTQPQILKTWFSPYNGLFLYCPFYLILILLVLSDFAKKALNGTFLLLLFCALSYVLSCWWDYGFGCSFGARSFVEYLAIFSIPLAGFLSRFKIYGSGGKLMVILIVLLCVGYNLKMTYSYDGCFYGNKNWDWEAYLQHLFLPTK